MFCSRFDQDNLQSRPHELEEAIKSFETPKARIPYRLHNRANNAEEETPGSNQDVEDDDKEGEQNHLLDLVHPCMLGKGTDPARV